MCAAWADIWFEVCTSCFYKSKTEETKRGGKSAIWPILCCRLSITVVSTPPSSMDFRHFWLRGRSRGPRNHFDDHEGTEFQKIIAFRHEILYSSFSLEFMYVYFLFVNRGFMQYMYAPSLCKPVKCIVFFVVDLESSQLKYIWWPQTSNKLRAFGTTCCVGSFLCFQDKTRLSYLGLFFLCREVYYTKPKDVSTNPQCWSL